MKGPLRTCNLIDYLFIDWPEHEHFLEETSVGHVVTWQHQQNKQNKQ
jgi:hypothetical protein